MCSRRRCGGRMVDSSLQWSNRAGERQPKTRLAGQSKRRTTVNRMSKSKRPSKTEGPSAQLPSPSGGAEDFLRAVLRSELLTREQLKTGLKAVPRLQRDDPVALAEHLIRFGRLTRY